MKGNSLVRGFHYYFAMDIFDVFAVDDIWSRSKNQKVTFSIHDFLIFYIINIIHHTLVLLIVLDKVGDIYPISIENASIEFLDANYFHSFFVKKFSCILPHLSKPMHDDSLFFQRIFQFIFFPVILKLRVFNKGFNWVVNSCSSSFTVAF